MSKYTKETTKIQQEFIDKAEALGFEIHEYSGRFMYGAICPAIHVDDLSDFRDYNEYYRDNLGLGYVIYCR